MSPLAAAAFPPWVLFFYMFLLLSAFIWSQAISVRISMKFFARALPVWGYVHLEKAAAPGHDWRFL